MGSETTLPLVSYLTTDVHTEQFVATFDVPADTCTRFVP